MHPENLVNTICQKPVKGILSSFGHRCNWVYRYADYPTSLYCEERWMFSAASVCLFVGVFVC